jgi:hypothetical protein
MLELDDIQHILLARTPAMTGRYEFLSFDNPAGGRAWLSELIPIVESAATVQTTMDATKRWITLAFTWNGLRALGVPQESLATFPEEFRQGMAARADILGDTGDNHPDNWVGGLAGDDLHALAMLFARDDAEHATRHRSPRRVAGALRRCTPRVVSGSQRHTAVQLRARPFRIPGSTVAAGDRGIG